MLYGLKDEQLRNIRQVLQNSPHISAARIFGSRAKGNFKTGSDIDLALFGNELNLKDILYLYQQLEDLELPYTFDLVIFDRIKEPDLAEHIERVGKIIFEK